MDGGKDALEKCCKHALEIKAHSYSYIKNSIASYAPEKDLVPIESTTNGSNDLVNRMKYKVPDEQYSLTILLKKQEKKENER